MILRTFEPDGKIGDFYFYLMRYDGRDSSRVIRIGGEDEPYIMFESGKGKLLKYMLDNVNQFFDVEHLSLEAQIRSSVADGYLRELSGLFQCSKIYEMHFCFEGRKKRYGLVEKNRTGDSFPMMKKRYKRKINKGLF